MILGFNLSPLSLDIKNLPRYLYPLVRSHVIIEDINAWFSPHPNPGLAKRIKVLSNEWVVDIYD